MSQPWFFESSQGQYFNEWTWTHVLWGGLLYYYLQDLPATMIAKIVYEMIEGQIFPVESRDTSMENHLGDLLAGLAGALAAGASACDSRPRNFP